MRVPLTGGAYQARSIIANAQRCLNLYGERNPEGAPCPETYYPTPGLTLRGTAPNNAPIRALYAASNGQLFAVAGGTVYYVSSGFAFSSLGTIGTTSGPVSAVDNGTVIVLVDGSTRGFSIDLASHAMTEITTDAFYGADRVRYIDTYFVLNRPGTRQFYISDSNAISFDPLWIASKVASSDLLVTVDVAHREVWLFGENTSEVWIDAGTADFPFQAMQGVLVDYGCAAKHSVARQDNSVFWLSRDRAGQGIVLRGASYQAKRISTYAIETAISGYSRIDDAIGFCYQQQGHAFYVLTFPTADKTWVCDISADNEWHERAWIDGSGAEHRHRANCFAFAYNRPLVGDWENSNIYELDLTAFTDNGAPIKRVRSFPHMVNDGKRVFYRQLIADMEVGTVPGTLAGNEALVSLRWSDTRGASWGNPVTQGLGATGEFLTNVQWQRLGMARDRVFELSWSAPVKTALNGAFIDTKMAGT